MKLNKLEDKRFPHRLVHSLHGLLTQPSHTLAILTPRLGESFLIVGVLILTAALRGVVEVINTEGADRVWWAILGTAFGIVLAWVSLTALFHLIARALGGTGSYANLLALMGYAATPMSLTSLVSLAIYLVSPVLLPNLGGARWGLLHNLIGWIGMTWGWPGVLSYYAIRQCERLSALKAMSIVAVIYILTVVGWFLPVFAPELFKVVSGVNP